MEPCGNEPRLSLAEPDKGVASHILTSKCACEAELPVCFLAAQASHHKSDWRCFMVKKNNKSCDLLQGGGLWNCWSQDKMQTVSMAQLLNRNFNDILEISIYFWKTNPRKFSYFYGDFPFFQHLWKFCCFCLKNVWLQWVTSSSSTLKAAWHECVFS